MLLLRVIPGLIVGKPGSNPEGTKLSSLLNVAKTVLPNCIFIMLCVRPEVVASSIDTGNAPLTPCALV